MFSLRSFVCYRPCRSKTLSEKGCTSTTHISGSLFWFSHPFLFTFWYGGVPTTVHMGEDIPVLLFHAQPNPFCWLISCMLLTERKQHCAKRVEQNTLRFSLPEFDTRSHQSFPHATADSWSHGILILSICHFHPIYGLPIFQTRKHIQLSNTCTPANGG